MNTNAKPSSQHTWEGTVLTKEKDRHTQKSAGGGGRTPVPGQYSKEGKKTAGNKVMRIMHSKSNPEC